MILSMHGSSSAPSHIFGDILARIPSQSKPLSKMAPEGVKDFMLKNGKALYTPAAKAYCFKQNRDCCIWDELGSPGAPEDRAGLLVSAAGFCCTDWSPRRTAKKPGLAGATAPVMYHWLEENRQLKPDILFWENSAAFEPKIVTEYLGDEYVHEFAEIGPDVLGWPQTRPRLFGVAVLRESCFFEGSAQEFLSLFLKRVQLDGDAFFQGPEKDVKLMMQELAQHRGHGAVESPSFNMAFNPSSVVTMQEYAKLRQTRAGVRTGAFLCDMEQSPSFAASGSFLPSCPTHSTIYSFVKGRVMTGKELLAAMGALAALATRN